MSADLAASTSTDTTTAPSPTAHRTRLLGTLLALLGVLMLVGGVGAWGAVTQSLHAERAIVADDAPAFAGATIDTPWEAWSQAEAMEGHLAAMTGGRTFAELDREDPQRPAVATGTFVRGSLMTSVIAFGVALAVVGVGTGFVIGGLGLRNAAARR